MDVVHLIYIFDDKAGSSSLHLRGELYKYLIKVRRHGVGDIVQFRSQENIAMLHSYKLIELQPREVVFELIDSQTLEVKSVQDLHIGWCIIDPKSVEKVLPSLCEIGVAKISFISCQRSQHNFKIDFKRYNRILEASMQQCGRTSMMEFAVYKNLATFIEEYPQTKVFDFTQKILDSTDDFQTVLIGCEGGFSPEEKKLLETQEVFRLNSPMVLRSESAVMAVASKILL